MRSFLLRLSYVGTRFHGWQRQEGLRTVQGTLEQALARLSPEGFALGTSSRTDAGVHALGHPVVVTVKGRLPGHGLAAGLNSLFPEDLAVVEWHRVGEGFDSRRAAVAKTYRYQIFDRATPDPFLQPVAWSLKRSLDLAPMRVAAVCLLGEHRFDAFRSVHCDASHTLRLINALVVERRGPLVTMTITGNAFLRNMVRIIAGTLVEVGLGRRPPEWVGEVLRSGDRTLAGRTVPACGLTLVGVDYPPELLCDGAHGW